MKALLVSIILVSTPMVFAKPKMNDYSQIKENIVHLDESSREIMATLYLMNKRLKRLSSQREKTKIKLMTKENQVQNLTKDILSLEAQLKEQRKLLSRRMRTLYMLGEDKFLQMIFTAQSAEDLNQSLYYLERFAKKDFEVVASFKKNLVSLQAKQEKLKSEVKKLIAIRDNLSTDETTLNSRQNEKSKYLSSLGKRRQSALKKLKEIRKDGKSELAGLLDMSFFEKKGSIKAPFKGAITQGYGIMEHPEFGYKLIHKGISYESVVKSDVNAIFKGTVVHIGEMPTYGKTLILDHGDHYYSLYSGLKDPDVKLGQIIETSQVIDKGLTELYFEIRHFSDAVNPITWFQQEAS